MYERFFGLHERPFDLLPNPRFLYLARGHREAFANLRYGLTVPRGLTLLIGEEHVCRETALGGVGVYKGDGQLLELN